MNRKNVLYIGSGNSSHLFKKLNLYDYYIVALNNAWRHFPYEGRKLDMWIHSGDFPREWRPEELSIITREVSHPEYEKGVRDIVLNSLNKNAVSPPHWAGYTMFFQGLYFIANELKPDKISLLGFDHDYNPAKVEKWKDDGQPNPQNNFKRVGGETIKESLEKNYGDMEADSFYGHGTPDPLRLGEGHLQYKFELAINNFEKLGIELVNLSPVISNINIIKKESIL